MLLKKIQTVNFRTKVRDLFRFRNGDTQRTIASLIGVSPSAVSRSCSATRTSAGLPWRLAHEMAMERRERLPGNRATPEWITEMLEAPVSSPTLFGMAKGSIENANKLIRQYIPKGASFKDYPPDRLKRIQHRLNERPRKNWTLTHPKLSFTNN